MKRLIGLMGLTGLICGAAVAAPELRGLPAETRALLGATHEMVISYSDLTMASTNTAQTFTNAIPAKMAAQFVMLKLSTAFDTGNTNFTGSVLLSAGDGSDVDLFITSTELASDGTEVYLKYGPPNSVTIVATSTILTNVLYAGITGNVTVVTGVTSAGTVGELGSQLYAADGSLIVTMTPNLNEALASNTSGKVTLYFKLFDAR